LSGQAFKKRADPLAFVVRENADIENLHKLPQAAARSAHGRTAGGTIERPPRLGLSERKRRIAA